MTSFLQRARGAAGSFSYCAYEKEISLQTPRLCKKTIGKGDKKMKSKKAVRSALGMSVLSIALCAAMLIGTTFAWFTDTASTAVNKIQAGTLKVDIVKAENGSSIKGESMSFVNKDGSDDILWEPGVTFRTPAFQIKNIGTLAIKYKLALSGVTGSSKLLKVIQFSVVKNDGTAVDLDKFEGTLTLEGDSVLSEPLYIQGHMEETAGNEYQNETLEGLGITVYATQYTYEYDSKDNQYDFDSDYTKVIAAGKTFSDGTHVISTGITATDKNAIAVKAAGANTNVTITGGSFDGGSGGNNVCVAAADGATVTIKNGTFTVGGDADGYGNSVVYSQGGNIVIEGGFFYTNYSYNGKYYVLNLNNSNPGSIVVTGGTFVNFNPAGGDDNVQPTDFVADGYSVVTETQANGDVWYTVIEGAYKEPASQEELDSAISSNTKATVKLSEGTYTLPGELSGKDITVVGTKDTVIDMKEKTSSHAENVAFEGVTVNFGTSDYKGFQHTGKLTYKDCTITGKQFLYGENVEFDNCTFVQDAVDYNVWTYGAGKVLFKDCEFDCQGKAVLIYNEGHISTQTVEFQNCEFNASSAVADKAAIEIDATYTSYNVVIDKATSDQVTGFGTETASGSSVWNVKAQVKPTTVTVNGVTVYSK